MSGTLQHIMQVPHALPAAVWADAEGFVIKRPTVLFAQQQGLPQQQLSGWDAPNVLQAQIRCARAEDSTLVSVIVK
jgi:hypothetical protein